MKLDTHCHSKGVSFCSDVTAEHLVRLNKIAGVGAFVLTNHYSKTYMDSYPINSFDAKIKMFLNEYYLAKAEGERHNVHVLLGAEVAIKVKDVMSEFLLFGTDEKFFLSNPMLYDCDQQSLYKICRDNKVLMYQAHPLRVEQNHHPADPEFLDGFEINLSPCFLRRDTDIIAMAGKYDKGITCGSDFHYANQAGNGGIILPPTVITPKKLAQYLRKNKRPDMYYNKFKIIKF